MLCSVALFFSSRLGHGLARCSRAAFPVVAGRLLLTVLLSAVIVCTASAQTAHFSWSQSAIGSGVNGPYGVAVDASGNVYIADTQNGRVLKETLSAGVYSQSVVASGFTYPTGIAVDGSGDVFVADTSTNTVWKETLSNGVYSPTNIGSGLGQPSYLALDASGNVYISDYLNSRVVEETLSNGSYSQSVVVSGLNQPGGVAVDASGNLYIVNSHSEVLKETPSGSSYTQSTIAISGNGTSTAVAVDAIGNLYISDIYNGEVLKETLSSGSYTQSVSVNGLKYPQDITLDASGNLYIADTGNSRVLLESPAALNFGSVSVVSPGSTQTLIFTLDTGGSIAAPAVLTQGAVNQDFTDAKTGSCTTNGTSQVYSAGDLCTVDVIFTPKASGVRYGAVELTTANGALIVTSFIEGVGVQPQASFVPGMLSYLGGDFGAWGIAVDAGGDVYAFVGDLHPVALLHTVGHGWSLR